MGSTPRLDTTHASVERSYVGEEVGFLVGKKVGARVGLVVGAAVQDPSSLIQRLKIALGTLLC